MHSNLQLNISISAAPLGCRLSRMSDKWRLIRPILNRLFIGVTVPHPDQHTVCYAASFVRSSYHDSPLPSYTNFFVSSSYCDACDAPQHAGVLRSNPPVCMKYSNGKFVLVQPGSKLAAGRAEFIHGA